MATFKDVQKVLSFIKTLNLSVSRTKEIPGTNKWMISCSNRDVDGSYNERIKRYTSENKITGITVNFVI